LEAIAKPQIAFEGKAKADEKAQRVLKGAIRRLDLNFAQQNNRFSTQPSSVRWGFELAFMHA
jgi:hypothetical protein